MRIPLDRLGDEPSAWRQRLTFNAETLERPELLGLGEVLWQGSVERENGVFRLDGRLEYEQTVTCGRCLEPLVLPVESDVRLRLVTTAPAAAEGEIELTEDDLETVYVEGEEMDTLQLVREQLLLNIPMRSLCSEECLGLCPTCGANRNCESCGCDQVEVDPRWEALKNLRDL
ncbi:MAG: DUF177 domain-containing protein [Thermoanaerobaculia bacterium]